MTNFTDQEIIALYMGIIKVSLSPSVNSASDKIRAELANRGIDVEYRHRPKAKYQKRAIGEYHFIRGIETIAVQRP
jgi:hypothetical protein